MVVGEGAGCGAADGQEAAVGEDNVPQGDEEESQ